MLRPLLPLPPERARSKPSMVVTAVMPSAFGEHRTLTLLSVLPVIPLLSLLLFLFLLLLPLVLLLLLLLLLLLSIPPTMS